MARALDTTAEWPSIRDGVDHSAEAGPVELGRGQRAVLGPVVLLPVEREDGPPTAAAPGILDRPQRLGDRGGAGEVDAAQPHAGVREVCVSVDEGGQHQGALEVDDGVDDLGVAHRRPRSSPTQPRRPSTTTKAVASGRSGVRTRPRR